MSSAYACTLHIVFFYIFYLHEYISYDQDFNLQYSDLLHYKYLDIPSHASLERVLLCKEVAVAEYLLRGQLMLLCSSRAAVLHMVGISEASVSAVVDF